ncbi:DUF1579 family protein [Salinarimonas soli]|uniref:DUF1579 domain-containing protein n=1 Tax=Salinarimonas soli TaxID=1638099 RepID=A0A5B2VCY2_9HYPH|nr:DUF1579 family protein [Salinarimonas soli]KAA2236320.1 DUF1579 domain-containing protein [Salinarimonas soli]
MTDGTQHHDGLARLLGTWEGEGEIHPSPWSAGGPARGRWSLRLGPGGHCLVGDYAEERADGEAFAGHGILAVDRERDELLWFWFDSLGLPPVEPARGAWHGDALVLVKRTPRGVGRTTFDLAGDGLVHAVTFEPPEGGPARPVATLAHRRIDT